MGRWSKRLAPGFLELAVLVEGGAVLDEGCGTGSLTFEIAARRIAASIDALDYEFGLVEAANTGREQPATPGNAPAAGSPLLIAVHLPVGPQTAIWNPVLPVRYWKHGRTCRYPNHRARWGR